MNLYDLKKDLQEKHPKLDVTLRFTEVCKKGYDIAMIEGKPAIAGHVVYNKVQVEVQGQEPYLEKIQNHRQALDFPNFKFSIVGMSEASVTDSMLNEVASNPEETHSEILDRLSTSSLISRKILEERLQAIKTKEKSKKEIPIIVE